MTYPAPVSVALDYPVVLTPPFVLLTDTPDACGGPVLPYSFACIPGICTAGCRIARSVFEDSRTYYFPVSAPPVFPTARHPDPCVEAYGGPLVTTAVRVTRHINIIYFGLLERAFFLTCLLAAYIRDKTLANAPVFKL